MSLFNYDYLTMHCLSISIIVYHCLPLFTIVYHCLYNNNTFVTIVIGMCNNNTCNSI